MRTAVTALFAAATIGGGVLAGVANAQQFDDVTLKVAMIDEPREWAFRDRLAEFEAKTGIDVQIDTFGFEDLFNKVLTASAGRTGEYDIYQFHYPDMALFDEKGFMVDITDWVQRDAEEMQLDDIHPAMQESHMKWDGRYYGVPTHAGGMNFYYRKDIFEEQGYELPQTWDDVVNIAADVDAKYDDVDGFVFMGRADIQGAATFQNIFGAFGGEYFDANGRPQLNSDAAIRAMETLVALQPYSVEASPSYGFDEAQTAFKQGKAAMVVFWDSGDNFFADESASDIVGKWAIAPMPGGRATNGGWSVQISRDSKNPEAAFEFLKWIVSPEMERELVPLTPSVRVSILRDPEFAKHPSYPGFLTLLNGKPFNFPQVTPNLQILQRLAEAQNAVTTGQVSIEDAMNDLQSDVESIAIRFGIWKP